MTILERPEPRDRLSTGAPVPPPIWQIVCEFANGSCVCARTRGAPCDSVAAVEQRILARAVVDLGESYEMRRRAKR